MKLFFSLTVFSLAGLVLSAPTYNDEQNNISITKDMYNEDDIVYSGNHHIIKLLVPINGLNGGIDDSTEYNPNSNEIDLNLVLFFVEADIDSNGNRVDRGLYVRKDGKVTKILEHGRDVAASRDNSKIAFFGAKDGIYAYDYKTNSAYKYGIIDDSIISIGKEKTGDVIYILTEDQEFYKISGDGMEKERINDVFGARHFVLDSSDNIYFYTDENQVYVRTADGVKKIEGLPKHPSSITLISPPLYVLDDIVPIVVDNGLYVISANGTSNFTEVVFEPNSKPSAFAPDALLIQYYAYNKNIYEFNVLEVVYVYNILSLLNDIIEERVTKLLPDSNYSR